MDKKIEVTSEIVKVEMNRFVREAVEKNIKDGFKKPNFFVFDSFVLEMHMKKGWSLEDIKNNTTKAQWVMFGKAAKLNIYKIMANNPESVEAMRIILRTEMAILTAKKMKMMRKAKGNCSSDQGNCGCHTHSNCETKSCDSKKCC